MGAPSWGTWSIREQREARQASMVSSPPPQHKRRATPGSKVVTKSLFQSAPMELVAPKGKSPKPEAPPTKAEGSRAKKPKKKAKTGSGAESKMRNFAPDTSESKESERLFEQHDWVPAAKHIPKKKKKKVAPATSSDSDSSKLPSPSEPLLPT